MIVQSLCNKSSIPTKSYLLVNQRRIKTFVARPCPSKNKPSRLVHIKFNYNNINAELGVKYGII
jgi:hypothetical protein